MKNFPRGDDELSLNQVECSVLVLTLHCTCHGEKKGEDGKTQHYIDILVNCIKKITPLSLVSSFGDFINQRKWRRKSLTKFKTDTEVIEIRINSCNI